MSALGLVLFEAYSLWQKSISSCASCAPAMFPCVDRRKAARHEVEKPDFVIHSDQPGFVPPPSLDPLAGRAQAPSVVERPASAWRRGGRRNFSVQKRMWSRVPSSTRRTRISAPTNFQHISTGSLQFPPASRARQRPRSFRPLELSIHAVNNYLSPMIPDIDQERQRCISPPRPAHTRAGSFDSDASTLGDQESSSSSSFHIPRRPVPRRSTTSSDGNGNSPPRIPSRSRLRAVLTSPERVDMMVERIASAMLEREILQSEIDSIVERQSVYTDSRPSTAHGVVEKIAPMPSIPATPAAAPSFAERLSLDRPQISPRQAVATGVPAGKEPPNFDFSHLPQNRPRLNTPPITELIQRALVPPLPLVLRPPLRKKKSFSRVPTWIFPGGGGGSGGAEHQRDRGVSFDSVTNNDGFYTCIAPESGRDSIATISTFSSWSGTEDAHSYRTTLSPPLHHSPMMPSKQGASTAAAATTPRTSRMMTFGRLSITTRQHRPLSVGIAY